MISNVTYLPEAVGNFPHNILSIRLHSRIEIGKLSLLSGARVGKSKFSCRYSKVYIKKDGLGAPG